MKVFLCSLYYEKNRITGANKRFDFFGKYLMKRDNVSVIAVVRKGEIPSWAAETITLPRYESLSPILRRIFYFFHLMFLFSKITGVIVSDFMPVPLWFTKKNTYYQLVHDIRNFTEYNRAGLKKISSAIQKIQWTIVPNILTVSEFTKSQLISFCKIKPEKIFVSYNGIEEENRMYKKRDIDFLYIATFEKRKNHNNLIRAFYSYVNKINSNACMYLIGRDLGCKENIKNLVDELDLTHSIIFLESVTEGELSDLYERTRTFVSPSLYEGFGMPIVEAMYFGCNIACSDIDVFREIAGGHATYFNPCDVDNILNGMHSSVMKSNDNPDSISYVKSKFLWDSIISQFLKMVEK